MGSANVRVTATDRNGGVSQTYQTAVDVADWDLRVDPNDSSKTNLVWGGTNGLDAFGFLPSGVVIIQAINNQYFIVPQFVTTGTFNGKLIVYAQGGSDLIYADAMTQSTSLFGGDGDDVLVGGRGSDSLEGGDGRDVLFGGTLDTDASDVLVGGPGDDILVGNYGADWMYGGGGQDLLISGRLLYANLPAAVFSIQAEWLSGRSYAERVANLTGTGTGARFNGNVFLTPGVSVLNDGGVDRVFGDADQDWFLVDLALDVVGDLSAGETATDI
jgi:Ca2+-binding RTX toxin-like protein